MLVQSSLRGRFGEDDFCFVYRILVPGASSLKSLFGDQFSCDVGLLQDPVEHQMLVA